MTHFWSLVRQSRAILMLALLTSLVSGFGNAGLVALINQALGASTGRLRDLGVRFAILGAVVLITRTVSQTLFMYLGQAAKASLRLRTIRRIGDAAYRDLEAQGSARSLAVLTQDLDTIVMLFVRLPVLVTQGAVVAGCLVYLGYLSWPILGVAIVTICIGAAGFRVAHRRAMADLRGSRRKEDDLVRHFRALFDGAKELKLHARRRAAFIDDTLAVDVEAVRVQRTRGYVLYAAAGSWGSFILLGFIGITLFVIARAYPMNTQVMSGYAMVFLYMIMPIEGLLSAIPNIGSAKVALERIEQVNAELSLEASLGTHAPAAFDSIRLDGVTHRYYRESDNEMFTLGPIDFVFRPGEVVYLIGGNGSGKTTLAKMIVGLYPPQSGRILLDGHAVGDGEWEAYRQLFSVVFSDFFLFDSLLGLRLDGIEDEVATLLVRLQIQHKVSIVDGVFSTLALSQGQRKRLALLVAYLEDRPFYLFDEWAADQDPVFKEVFYRTLLPSLRRKGKAVLVVTHDDRYFHLADRIMKLESGRLVDAGDATQPRDPVSA